MSGVKIPAEESNLYVPDFIMDFLLHELSNVIKDKSCNQAKFGYFCMFIIWSNRQGVELLQPVLGYHWDECYCYLFDSSVWLLRLPWQPSHTKCGLNLKYTVTPFLQCIAEMEVATKWMSQNQSELVSPPDNGFADMYMKIPLGYYRVVDGCSEKVLYCQTRGGTQAIFMYSCSQCNVPQSGQTRKGWNSCRYSIHVSSSNFTHYGGLTHCLYSAGMALWKW